MIIIEVKFKKLTLALDMYGCPNRCKHCWVGHSPNGHMAVDDLKKIAAEFKPYTYEFEIFDWYREPDFKDNYKELWELRKQLSDKITPHYELISVWRIVRDSSYVKWLVSLGLKKAQLTLFGGEATTDYYTGRKGAYREILQAIDILTENKISLRIQVFINKDNIDELPHIENLILENRLSERCADFGGEFDCFVYQGSCDGENAKLYDVRITKDDLKKIPPLLSEYTLKYFHTNNLNDIFGQTEQELYNKYIVDNSTVSYVSDNPVLFIDNAYNVYPNISTPAPYWCLGNLKKSSAEEILQNYLTGMSVAQTIRCTIPLSEIVERCGDPNSMRLFGEKDYVIFLLNQYCEKEQKNGSMIERKY